MGCIPQSHISNGHAYEQLEVAPHKVIFLNGQTDGRTGISPHTYRMERLTDRWTHGLHPQHGGCSPCAHEWENVHKSIAIGRSVRPSACPPRTTLRHFKDFRYRPEIWWRYIVPWSRWIFTMAMLGIFCAFHGALKFSMIGLDQVWGTTSLL